MQRPHEIDMSSGNGGALVDGTAIIVAVGPKRRQQSVRIRGWSTRYINYPAITTQVQQYCDAGSHTMIFRGTKEIPFQHKLFAIGLKSLPMFYASGLGQKSDAVALTRDRKQFETLVQAYLSSPMSKAQRHRSTPEAFLASFERLTFRQRVRLSQLLLYGIQYQNQRPDVANWRKKLYMLSASLLHTVALKYAVWPLPSGELSDQAFVVEYAPPTNGGCYERVSSISEEFEKLSLGKLYKDRDTEVFVPFAMLPHYVLGYSILRRLAVDDMPTYEVSEYRANPTICNQGYSLDRPKDLHEEQVRFLDECAATVALAYFDCDAKEWRFLREGAYQRPIDTGQGDRLDV